MPVDADEDFIVPFGISADTGRPIADVSDQAVSSLISSAPDAEVVAHEQEKRNKPVSFAVIGECDPNDLSQSGWGVIFAPGVDRAIKDALAPLIEHRKANSAPFVIYDGDTSVMPNESARQWLTRRNVRLDVVDPAKGVPFYLLIVGPPDAISFEFQYWLDIYWAVGRLWFDTADQFRQYAESVVRYETQVTVATTRNMAMFATAHDFDSATQLFTRNVAKPLSTGEGTTPTPIGSRQKFGLHTLFGPGATKDGFANLIRGRTPIGSPSLLFSGSHGMQFNPDDARQAGKQGAIVCQDWGGYGEITENHWFAATDVPSDAKVHGMMHVFYACHGGGCPELDNFDRLNTEPRRIAPKPFFAKLPSRLLSHENGGALAVLAHIERAWTYSFQGDKGVSQTQGFRDVIGRLLRGDRIGQATDVFNTRWTALSAQLAEAQVNRQQPPSISLTALGKLWVARDDARNFIVLGDPAVRLRVENLAVT